MTLDCTCVGMERWSLYLSNICMFKIQSDVFILRNYSKKSWNKSVNMEFTFWKWKQSTYRWKKHEKMFFLLSFCIFFIIAFKDSSIMSFNLQILRNYNKVFSFFHNGGRGPALAHLVGFKKRTQITKMATFSPVTKGWRHLTTCPCFFYRVLKEKSINN